MTVSGAGAASLPPSFAAASAPVSAPPTGAATAAAPSTADVTFTEEPAAVPPNQVEISEADSDVELAESGTIRYNTPHPDETYQMEPGDSNLSSMALVTKILNRKFGVDITETELDSKGRPTNKLKHEGHVA